jgi:hypothetical protein
MSGDAIIASFAPYLKFDVYGQFAIIVDFIVNARNVDFREKDGARVNNAS